MPWRRAVLDGTAGLAASPGFTAAGSPPGATAGFPSAARTASSTTDLPAAAKPFITLAALSITPIVPLMALIGSLPARMVSSTVSVNFAKTPVGAARSANLLSRNST